MNRFGEIADELTDLIEELDRTEPGAGIKALKAALERAFARACEAERALRLKTEAEARAGGAPARPKRPAAGASAAAKPPRSAIVIELPRPWRTAAAAARRLND
jgi:hypothetical protein